MMFHKGFYDSFPKCLKVAILHEEICREVSEKEITEIVCVCVCVCVVALH